MSGDILFGVGDAIAWTIGVPLILFMLVYGFGSDWRKDPLGVERMFQKGYLLALWVVIMAGNFLPHEYDTFRAVLRILVFSAVTIVLTLQVINLRRIQTQSSRPLFFTWLTYAAQRERERQRKRQ